MLGLGVETTRSRVAAAAEEDAPEEETSEEEMPEEETSEALLEEECDDAIEDAALPATASEEDAPETLCALELEALENAATEALDAA